MIQKYSLFESSGIAIGVGAVLPQETGFDPSFYLDTFYPGLQALWILGIQLFRANRPWDYAQGPEEKFLFI